MSKIEITIAQLKALLDEQKMITIAKCLSHSYYYNKESTEGVSKSLPIDEDKFREQGMQSKYPKDFEVLDRYIK
jgi:energy-converting hydrogenase A subunit M